VSESARHLDGLEESFEHARSVGAFDFFGGLEHDSMSQRRQEPLMSSGVTKSRPARAARDFARRTMDRPARGEAPSASAGLVRVALSRRTTYCATDASTRTLRATSAHRARISAASLTACTPRSVGLASGEFACVSSNNLVSMSGLG
jgi:hypothetical protein